MDDSTIQFFSIILILLALVVTVIAVQRARRRRRLYTLRDLNAFGDISLMTGAAVEASRPLHLAFGSAGPGGDKTLLALAGAEYFYHVIQHAAIGNETPLITTSDPYTLPLAQDTLRRALAAQDRLERYNALNARWYPAGRRSMAYAAALTGMMTTDRTGGHILAGSFGTELALVLDAAYRHRQPTTAVSDQLEGQAIAYALADNVLIGEEVFAAGAYLDESAVQQSETLTMDTLRWLLVLAMLVLFVVTVLQELGG